MSKSDKGLRYAIAYLKGRGLAFKSEHPRDVLYALARYRNIGPGCCSVSEKGCLKTLRRWMKRVEVWGPKIKAPPGTPVPAPYVSSGSSNKKKKRKKSLTKKPLPASDFLSSWEWTTLRYQTLQKYGRKCMCCGRSPKDGVIIHVDHILPRSTHPQLALEPTNLQVLCGECNRGKGNWDTTDFRHEVEQERPAELIPAPKLLQ